MIDIDVAFTLNGVDYSPYLSEYTVLHEIEQRETVVTLDGTEYTATQIRPSIVFSLVPLSDEQSESLYEILSRPSIEVTYTDPYLRDRYSVIMRVTSELNSSFIIRANSGNRYYEGNSITLRSRTVL